jgi:ABC-type sugar transport system ATPase subunit
MASVTLDRLTKAFGSTHTAVRELTLKIDDGELLVLVGPSGCGKSTVLRLIAGLEAPVSGQILIDGRDVTHVPPQHRDVAMVFQSYALYPHKTVRENLAFSLRVRRIESRRIDERVSAVATLLGIESLLDRKPGQLSGGQQQRVALGRAIVREPHVFLLDEPLSNLDPLLRVSTRTELALLHRRLGATMVHVTHDQEEAMTLGTRLAVMRDGALEQVGAGRDVYERPANVFVAGFIGAPAMNLHAAQPIDHGERMRLVAAGFALADVEAPRDAATLGVRPHDVALTDPSAGDGTARVELVEPLGATTLVHLACDGTEDRLRVVVPSDSPASVDDRVGFQFRRDRLHFFDAHGVRLSV